MFCCEFPNPNAKEIYRRISSRWKYIISYEHVSNKQAAEKNVTLRYVPEALGGEGSICVTLGQRYTRERAKYHWGKGLLLCVRVQQCGGRQSELPQAGTSKKSNNK